MTATPLCPVCSQGVSAPNLATCLSCRRDFHLIMRVDVDGKDCGEVWLHEYESHLIFGCRECLEAGLFAGDGPGAGSSERV